MMLETLHKGSKVLMVGLGIFSLCLLGCDESVPQAPEKTPPKVVSKKILKPAASPASIVKPEQNSGERAAAVTTPNGTEKKQPTSLEIVPGDTAVGQSETQALPKLADVPVAPVDEQLAKREQTLAESAVPLTDGIALIEPYDFKDRIDPFLPLLTEPDKSDDKEEEEKPERILTPLEKIELSQIKLVAVIQMQGRTLAMVEEASGKGYEVKLGTYMGRNGGQVTEINTTSIIVKESIKDFKGKRRERFQELKFHNDESGN
jgi:type IV pilus assembly protein PilP